MIANLKITQFGKDLVLMARVIQVEGETLNAKQLQAICSRLGNRFAIAATPYGINQLLVEQRERVPTNSFLVEGDWLVSLKATQDRVQLNLQNADKRKALSDLYRRALLIKANHLPDLERVNDSPRIFWDKNPLPLVVTNPRGNSWDDIQAFRRFEVADVFLDEAGLGFAIEISTAFKTRWSVLDYFASGNAKRFEELTSRQKEQKGTLIYHGPNGKVKCYFERYLPSKTLADTPAFSIGSKSYSNSYEYYRQEHPKFDAQPSDPVALVAFTGGFGSKYVPAKSVYLRVMNHMIDGELSQIDKIDPQQRDALVQRFWKMLGDKPFGERYVGISRDLYQATDRNSGVIPLPTLAFGQGKVLDTPPIVNQATYRRHFRQRKECLDQYGCYFSSPSMQTTLYIVFDETLPSEATDRFEKDIQNKMSQLVGKDIEIVPMFCNHYLEATSELNKHYTSGTVLFVFNDEQPATYHNISFELKHWQVKRITTRTLQRLYQRLKSPRPGKEEAVVKHWQSFIDMNAYALVQAFRCVPFALVSKMHYDAQLVIDVSEKHHYFALSLYIHKVGKVPVLDGFVVPKADSQKESINPAFLEHHIKTLIKDKSDLLRRYGVNSLLVKRDGQDFNEEYRAVAEAIKKSIEAGYLPEHFRYDFVEYHKSTQKKIRLWSRTNGQLTNVLEGSYLLLDSKKAVLATTGAGTLNQGTAEPVLIRTITDCDIRLVLSDIFLSSQLNYANPAVAQRLTVTAQRADDLLKEKMSMEVLRIS